MLSHPMGFRDAVCVWESFCEIRPKKSTVCILRKMCNNILMTRETPVKTRQQNGTPCKAVHFTPQISVPTICMCKITSWNNKPLRTVLGSDGSVYQRSETAVDSSRGGGAKPRKRQPAAVCVWKRCKPVWFGCFINWEIEFPESSRNDDDDATVGQPAGAARHSKKGFIYARSIGINYEPETQILCPTSQSCGPSLGTRVEWYAGTR